MKWKFVLLAGLTGCATPQSPRVAREIASMDQCQMVSVAGTKFDPEVRRAKMLPRGSALITDSGKLGADGITQIIHLATGSVSHPGEQFKPTAAGVETALANGLRLARDAGHKRVAIPLIGESFDLEVRTVLKERHETEIRFVADDQKELKLFNLSLSKHKTDELAESQLKVVQGDLTDGKLHGASVIFNPANMEIQFGGGLSGSIAAAVGAPYAKKIDADAARLIANYYASCTNPH